MVSSGVGGRSAFGQRKWVDGRADRDAEEQTKEWENGREPTSRQRQIDRVPLRGSTLVAAVAFRPGEAKEVPVESPCNAVQDEIVGEEPDGRLFVASSPEHNQALRSISISSVIRTINPHPGRSADTFDQLLDETDSTRPVEADPPERAFRPGPRMAILDCHPRDSEHRRGCSCSGSDVPRVE